KYRRPLLGGQVKYRLEELIPAKAGENGREIVALEVMPDHVHLFVKPHTKNSPSYVASQFKGFTSHHLRSDFPPLHSQVPTLCRPSYFVATVGAVSAETVQRYIETQYDRPKGGGRT